ncbi:hypothetical protein [Bdellovibrio sp. HCB2-146]|uniref:hypothetical protein n=1 Tax=Bdellovibrio sp. HCB2-146 TaxID=3394362 RepID=UPI0039BC2AF4
MKMKTMIATAALVILAGSQGMAQDESNVIFSCNSLPNVDSSLSVVGVADEQTGQMNVLVYIAGQLMAQDQGAFVEGTTSWDGSIFRIDFDQVSTITAKSENPVLSVGQADSLICQYPGAQ